MKNILAKGQSAIVEQFALGKTLLAFDFDGTLAPTTRDPRSAQLRKRTRLLLAELARRYPTAVISGRPRADVLARLGGVPLQAVIGNHGLEPSPDARQYHAEVKRWLPSLRAALEPAAGVEIENKLYTLAIHYRRAKVKRAALAAIRGAIESLGTSARAIDDRTVVHVLPSGAPGKAAALTSLQKSLQLERAIFVGEDALDEALFGASQAGDLLGVRVGRPAHSKAHFYLQTQRDVDRLLERLIALRPAPAQARAG